MANPVVYDLSGAVHDIGWLQANYASGLVYHPPKAYPAFDLKAIFMTTGATNLYFTVKKQDGITPQIGQPVSYTFPSLANPESSLKSLTGDKSLWAPRGVVELCDPDGKHNFQIGSDSWIRNGMGPYSVFVISPSTYSACLEGVGWLMGTNHTGPCSYLWQLVDGSAVPPPVDPDVPPVVPPVPGTGDLAETNALLRQMIAAQLALNAHLGIR